MQTSSIELRPNFRSSTIDRHARYVAGALEHSWMLDAGPDLSHVSAGLQQALTRAGGVVQSLTVANQLPFAGNKLGSAVSAVKTLISTIEMKLSSIISTGPTSALNDALKQPFGFELERKPL